MERKWSGREFESIIDRYRDKQCLRDVTSPQLVGYAAYVRQVALQCISVALQTRFQQVWLANHEFVASNHIGYRFVNGYSCVFLSALHYRC